MIPGRRAPVVAWLAGAVVCGVIVARTDFSADLSAFLPARPDARQQMRGAIRNEVRHLKRAAHARGPPARR